MKNVKLEDKGIHLISFDVPYPPAYGGTMDVFFKLYALHQAGIPVILHCFQYRRQAAPELKFYAKKIHYYPRIAMWKSVWSRQPAIIQSRANPELLKNLLVNDWPILFEGEHCCAFLGHKLLKERIRWVRIHNIESDYYRNLARLSTSFWKKIYYLIESFKLFNFEPDLKKATGLFSISESEIPALQKWNSNVIHLGPFHGKSIKGMPEGLGSYLLYHGNLAVEENENAAIWLLKNVTSEFPLVIAGANPGNAIQGAITSRRNTRLVTNPESSEMENLIENAQIIILPTFQSTGVKLKLVHSLYSGRHVLANSAMVNGSNLGHLCHIFENQGELNQKIADLINQPISSEIWKNRKLELEALSDSKKAEILWDWIQKGKSD